MKRIDNPADFDLCRFDGVSSTAVYLGPMEALHLVTGRLKWKKESMCGEKVEYLTLTDIAEQLKEYLFITVISIGPLSGAIYQKGNYADNEWWQIGNLDGYA